MAEWKATLMKLANIRALEGLRVSLDQARNRKQRLYIHPDECARLIAAIDDALPEPI